MQIAVVGVEHQSCPVEVREAMALVGPAELLALGRLQATPGCDESVVLSTCARTEIYLFSTDSFERAIAETRQLLIALNPDSAGYLKDRTAMEAVAHLFSVTSGLESQIVGEEEVGGQVRRAMETARQSGNLGSNLSTLFQAALACSRRVRRELTDTLTEANVASSALQMARPLADPTETDVLIVGTGTIARLLASEFREFRSVTMASRNPAAASRMASELGARVIAVSQALERPEYFGIICTASRTRKPIISRETLTGLRRRLVIFDLGLPRNVASDVEDLPDVLLFDIDDVRAPEEAHAGARGMAESIVNAEVHDFVSREALREVGPIIQQLREHVDRVRSQELARVAESLAHLDPGERETVELVVQRMMDRMFHHLVVRLRLAALTDIDLVRAAEFLFAHGTDSLLPIEADMGAVEGVSTADSTP